MSLKRPIIYKCEWAPYILYRPTRSHNPLRCPVCVLTVRRVGYCIIQNYLLLIAVWSNWYKSCALLWRIADGCRQYEPNGAEARRRAYRYVRARAQATFLTHFFTIVEECIVLHRRIVVLWDREQVVGNRNAIWVLAHPNWYLVISAGTLTMVERQH